MPDHLTPPAAVHVLPGAAADLARLAAEGAVDGLDARISVYAADTGKLVVEVAGERLTSYIILDGTGQAAYAEILAERAAGHP